MIIFSCYSDRDDDDHNDKGDENDDGGDTLPCPCPFSLLAGPSPPRLCH